MQDHPVTKPRHDARILGHQNDPSSDILRKIGHEIRHLRLNGHVQRGMSVVRQQQGRATSKAMAIITRDRTPPENALG